MVVVVLLRGGTDVLGLFNVLFFLNRSLFFFSFFFLFLSFVNQPNNEIAIVLRIEVEEE
jgi:hypothetical protein